MVKFHHISLTLVCRVPVTVPTLCIVLHTDSTDIKYSS